MGRFRYYSNPRLTGIPGTRAHPGLRCTLNSGVPGPWCNRDPDIPGHTHPVLPISWAYQGSNIRGPRAQLEPRHTQDGFTRDLGLMPESRTYLGPDYAVPDGSLATAPF